MSFVMIALVQLVMGDDYTPPGPITDFRVTGGTATTLNVAWTTPQDTDDGGVVWPVDLFVIAYSTQPLPNIAFPEPGYVVSNYPGVTLITIEYIQDIGGYFDAGTPLTCTINGLATNTPYHVAILAGDTGNWDRWSNWNQMSPEVVDRPRSDWVAPGQISDLALSGAGGDFTLGWTSTGDDGNAGLAAAFDLRWLNRPILGESDFLAAQSLSGAPVPAIPGTHQQVILHLAPSASYHFAIRAMDEAANLGPVSNSVEGAGVTEDSGGSGSGTKSACGMSAHGVGASLVFGFLLAALRRPQ